ncbi:hypothetical protein M408DRAFT_203373 [Serendipita vermifera MAFF 305830]|uniref:Uncharacterized protein n=1 Tax=Serendipita vermifera MAFF 305830 TaxID=933852 RepID=A0A0C2WH73_SERVB|nr:hypothetical protein M408DRAFT_203373 [Serendipita vermifera MAFF 305830]
MPGNFAFGDPASTGSDPISVPSDRCDSKDGLEPAGVAGTISPFGGYRCKELWWDSGVGIFIIRACADIELDRGASVVGQF